MKVQTRPNGYVLEASDETAQQLLDAGLFEKAPDDAPLGAPAAGAGVVKPPKKARDNGTRTH